MTHSSPRRVTHWAKKIFMTNGRESSTLEVSDENLGGGGGGRL